jgi:hypothetical protein
MILKNCFGKCGRLAGQNLVPDPPAMITANIFPSPADEMREKENK